MHSANRGGLNGMAANSFAEGVRPGGLTTSTEIRILLCYLLDCINTPVTKQQIEHVLLNEELVNYFVLAESLALLHTQGLIQENEQGYTLTETGRTVGQTLADSVPQSIRDTAVRGVILAQQYAAKAATQQCEIRPVDNGRIVRCSINDVAGTLFQIDMYMPDTLTANAVYEKFVNNGNDVYKLMLAALTDNAELAQNSLVSLSPV